LAKQPQAHHPEAEAYHHQSDRTTPSHVRTEEEVSEDEDAEKEPELPKGGVHAVYWLILPLLLLWLLLLVDSLRLRGAHRLCRVGDDPRLLLSDAGSNGSGGGIRRLLVRHLCKLPCTGRCYLSRRDCGLKDAPLHVAAEAGGVCSVLGRED